MRGGQRLLRRLGRLTLRGYDGHGRVGMSERLQSYDLMGGKTPVEKLGSGRCVLLGCLPAVYKLLGMDPWANIYEWVFPAKNGVEILICTVHGEHVEYVFWSRRDPGLDCSHLDQQKIINYVISRVRKRS